MRQWRGGESKDSYAEEKTGRSHKLPLLEQFFMTLIRLRLGLLEFNLAKRFDHQSLELLQRGLMFCFTV